MKTERRHFLRLAGMTLASGALPRLSWADAGAPAYLAAARDRSGAFVLVGLSTDGVARFRLPLPGRGHAAAAHPTKPLAVAFARRPGRFALVIDCALGQEVARLDAPEGRHFYGHGAFDAAGARLFTCENAYRTGDGVIGVWDVAAGFERIGEFPSGGIGPHETILDPARGVLVIANGGIQTHPDSGRAKLNIPTMRPNLAYVDSADGALRQRVEPPAELRLGSLRHLSLGPDGRVAVAAQWQGDPEATPPLLALHREGEAELTFLAADPIEQGRLDGYAGSVAFARDGRHVAVTSPRGGRLHVFDAGSGALRAALSVADVCGVAACADGFLATDGLGGVRRLDADGAETALARHAEAWDNHLVALTA